MSPKGQTTPGSLSLFSPHLPSIPPQLMGALEVRRKAPLAGRILALSNNRNPERVSTALPKRGLCPPSNTLTHSSPQAGQLNTP